MNLENAMGVIFPNMHDQNLPEFTAQRTMASVPFGGRYRLIDFPLSAMTTAGFSNVAVVVKSNYESLMDHLGNGREWDLSRKRGGLKIFPPFSQQDSGVYIGRMEALSQIMDYMSHRREKYVVLADCDVVCHPDLQQFVEAHRKSGADVTILYEQGQLTAEIAKGTYTLTFGEKNRVDDLRTGDDRYGDSNISMNYFVLERRFLMDLVQQAQHQGIVTLEKLLIDRGLQKLAVRGHRYTGYRSRIYSRKSYFDASMALLQPENQKALFHTGPGPIYTKVRDEAPSRYYMDNRILNSAIADGCLLSGEIENSLLFRHIKVEKGAKVQNSVLMQGTVVEEGAQVRHCITDKDVTITKGRVLAGSAENPIYVRKGTKV